MKVPIHCIDSVTDRLEAVYDRITGHAYEKWLTRRSAGQSLLPFWNAAEEELLCKPQTEVQEWGHGVTIQMTCPNVDPYKVRLFMTPSELLALAPQEIPGLDRWIFRYLRFAAPVDNLDATAEFEGGKLRLVATLLHAPEEAKVHFHVA